MISSYILLDSISPRGDRLTTFVCTFNRFILAELNTHRALSRNAASSRAIPVAKMISAVLDNPGLPVWWGKNQPGMQAKAELEGQALEDAKKIWLEARDAAVGFAQRLTTLGLHKQVANRLLEPFAHVTVLLSGTEWENFFALRAHPDAQPEFRALAEGMLAQYNASTPQLVGPSGWHIPFGDRAEGFDHETLIKVSVARAARLSYNNFEGTIDVAADVALYDKLADSGHLSPFEHAARVADVPGPCGNFKGWVQVRKMHPQEVRTDSRVKKHPRPDGLPEVWDMTLNDWESIQRAALQSSWIPPEYMRNDWVSDVCDFLRHGPGAKSDQRFGAVERPNLHAHSVDLSKVSLDPQQHPETPIIWPRDGDAAATPAQD